jgi:hypothetical protein
LEPECPLSYGNIRVFSTFPLARKKPVCHLLFTARGPERDAQNTTYRRQHSSKEYDHGSHEEEEEGEEGGEEVLIRCFFRIRKRLDENPAALLLRTLRTAAGRYSWCAMLLPSNT